MNFYNEIEPCCVKWLRSLIKAGLLPAGDVDDRPIEEVEPKDVRGYSQCHWFCGIGGWPLALRLAGIPDDYPCWTGSVPCQPWSDAGNSKGFADERHLWPEFYRLIKQCKPSACLGEQVASAIRKGFIDTVKRDLENAHYSVGFCVLGAHSVGAPHIRQRLYWVAGERLSRPLALGEPSEGCWLGDPPGERFQRPAGSGTARCDGFASAGKLGDAASIGRDRGSTNGGEFEAEMSRSGPCGLGDTDDYGQSSNGNGSASDAERKAALANGELRLSTFWSDCEWLQCRDGKFRPIKPGIRPLVDGISNRVAKLRAAGNAIVPQVAAEFIKAALGSAAEARNKPRAADHTRRGVKWLKA